MHRVFDWKRSTVWRRHVVALADDMINPAVRDVVNKAGPDRIVSDDSTWLDHAIQKTRKALSEDAFHALAKRLLACYSHVRVYHACRTTDTRSYYLRGLRVLRRTELRQMAIHLFVTPGSPKVTVGMIDDAIADMRLDEQDERVFVGLDDRHLIRCCGHYLIQGSECLMAVAVRLASISGTDCIGILRNLGRPTMVVCELPLSLLSEYELTQLSGIIVERLFEELLLEKALSEPLSFTVALTRDIPPAYVKRHYHPDGIPDPHNRQTPYYWRGE